MITCKHLNLLISRIILTSDHYYVDDGIMTFGFSEDDPETTGRYEVYCKDCGKQFVFTRSTMPKWMKNYLSQCNLVDG